MNEAIETIIDCAGDAPSGKFESEPIVVGPADEVLGEWRLFRERGEVPNTQGVYLVGLSPTGSPDALSPDVIYIGRAAVEGVAIRSRLSQFEKTATTGKDAHSGGWSYYAEVHQDNPAKRRIMYGTYCCWMVCPDPVGVEHDLIRDFEQKHGRKPLLNKR